MLKLGSLLVTRSLFHGHKNGGLILMGHSMNAVELTRSLVTGNGLFGVHCIGAFFVPRVTDNLIQKNNGPGILVDVANKAKVLL